MNNITIPNHIAIIMDGNRRWAKNINQSIHYGHKYGIKAIFDVIDNCLEFNVQYLTLFALSTENITNRGDAELSFILKYIKILFNKKQLNYLKNKNINIQIIGDFSLIKNSTIVNFINQWNDISKLQNPKLTVTICLPYGGKNDILYAVQKLIDNKNIEAKNITENDIYSNLMSNSIPDVDLLIRTGGEKRISNFLLWHLSYSEIIFLNIMWPEFKKLDLYNCIQDYQGREKRYGK